MIYIANILYVMSIKKLTKFYNKQNKKYYKFSIN